MRNGICALVLMLLNACATTSHENLYQQLGEKSGIERIVGRLIAEIGDEPRIRKYFANTNLGRFHEKLTEQIGELSGGPLDYSGDTMIQVHTGMDINEADFNLLAELLVNAMDAEHIPHTTQNQLIKLLTPMRPDIMYQ